MKKKIFVTLILLNFIVTAFGQKSLEELGLQYILEDSNKYNLGTDSLFINKVAVNSPPLKYFSLKKGWHIKGVLKENCYYTNDSIENKKIVDSNFILQSSCKNIYFIDVSSELKKKNEYIYVYKRFFYCHNIYILILIRNKYTLINKDVLLTMNNNGKIVAANSESYVR